MEIERFTVRENSIQRTLKLRMVRGAEDGHAQAVTKFNLALTEFARKQKTNKANERPNPSAILFQVLKALWSCNILKATGPRHSIFQEESMGLTFAEHSGLHIQHATLAC